MEEGIAVVTHWKRDGLPESYVLTFVGSPLRAFEAWVGKLPTDNVALGGFQELIPGRQHYDADTQANTIVSYKGPHGVRVYGFSVNDWEFQTWLQMAEEQEWGTSGSGRRAKFAQALQTWRKWAKKDGAKV